MTLSIAPLYSSSSGNATLVETEKTSILVDAGLAGCNIEKALAKLGRSVKELSAILITHEHNDHIAGVGVLSRRHNIPVYANEQTWVSMEGKIGEIAHKNIRIIEDYEFFIGDIEVEPIPISHDTVAPVGYALSKSGKKIGIMTDTGRVTIEMLNKLKNASIVLLEANHDVDALQCSRYPYLLKKRILSIKGHLSNDDSATAAVELAMRNVKGILLGHLSKENNFEALAAKTVTDKLEAAGILVGKDIALHVAKKFDVTGYYSIK